MHIPIRNRSFDQRGFMPPALRMAASTLALAFSLLACGGGGDDSGSGGGGFGPSFPPGTPGDFTRSVSVAGVTRNYLLHVPASYRGDTPAPVVLLLHGGGGSAATISAATGGFSALADRNGFIAVYPDSVAGTWDDGRETVPARTNDVAFIAALLDALALEYSVDAKRVHAAGISNGGMMSFRLGCELSNRIAAIATVAANMPAAITADCRPSRPLPVAMFSGTADPLMPYGGGTLPLGVGGTVLSAPDSAVFWAQKNQLALTPQFSALPDADAGDGTTTDLINYGGAASAGEVALYRINGGGHTWPGGTQYLPAQLIGPVARDFSANDAIWAFFARHPRP